MGVGSGALSTEDLDVHSVGNSQTLKETAIIEAENLKAAIEFEMKNSMEFNICIITFRLFTIILLDEASKESLQEMPPRTESELDPVTLHNMYVVKKKKIQRSLYLGNMNFQKRLCRLIG